MHTGVPVVYGSVRSIVYKVTQMSTKTGVVVVVVVCTVLRTIVLLVVVDNLRQQPQQPYYYINFNIFSFNV